jgi:signal transduction histidine kinase/ActR/RegA family two-component response regulator
LWNETPVALNLTILPPWWQTLWFRLAAGLGIIVLVVGGFSWRTYSIRARNRYLETEVAKRTSDLAEANQALQAANTETAQALVEAQAANRAKSAFLAHMSHELRTPLNGILGYAQIFDWDENLTKAQRHGLAVIQRSGDHLLNLINDVLDLARIEADHVVVRSATFDLQVFINELVDMLKPRARKKGLYFLAELRWLDSDGQLQPGDELPFVQTDSKLLRQVLINLIGNAMKFTQTGGVTLRISIGGQEASTGGEDNLSSSLTFRFEVADTGPGISAEDQKQIFVPFKQVGDIDYHSGGTGLGLSISQNRVDLLGGQLQVESEPGQGSTFWFELELPVVLPATDLNAAPVARRIVGVDGPSPTVLVVDDNVDNRAVLQEMLRRTGCRVYTAEDGAAGLATAEKTNPACIITDLIMPDISGNALIRQLRRQEQFADTVIIASSASVFEADRAESIVAGGNAFMPKPVRLENLHALLAEHLHAQWQYEESTLEETGPEHIFEEEPELPSDFVDKIHEAASVGDVAILHKVLSELEQLPAKYHHAASRLNRLVSNFQLTEVVAWMEKIKTPE